MPPRPVPRSPFNLQRYTVIRELLKRRKSSNGQPSTARAGGAATFSRKELREACGWSLTQVRVHLDRLVELEYLALRHGRLGSQFVYELLLDLDVPEAVAHVGLIDVEQLRHGYNSNLAGFSRGVAGQNGHLTGGGEVAPPPENATPASSESQPDGLAGLHIRRPTPVTALL